MKYQNRNNNKKDNIYLKWIFLVNNSTNLLVVLLLRLIIFEGNATDMWFYGIIQYIMKYIIILAFFDKNCNLHYN